MHSPKTNGRGFSLVEVMFAVVLLTITILGVMSTMHAVSDANTLVRERNAAAAAAAVRVQDLVDLASATVTVDDMVTFCSTYHSTGFAVLNNANQIGTAADFDGVVVTGGEAVPASPGTSLWPTDRAGAADDVVAQAGYVQVYYLGASDDTSDDLAGDVVAATDLSGAANRVRITVTVAWTSSVGGGEQAEKVAYSEIVSVKVGG